MKVDTESEAKAITEAMDGIRADLKINERREMFKQNERREMFKQVALAAISGTGILNIQTVLEATEKILRTADEFAKKEQSK